MTLKLNIGIHLSMQMLMPYRSRLPLPSHDGTEQDGMGNLFIKRIENLPITAMSLKGATQNDPILAKVLHFTLSGWPVKGCE